MAIAIIFYIAVAPTDRSNTAVLLDAVGQFACFHVGIGELSSKQGRCLAAINGN